MASTKKQASRNGPEVNCQKPFSLHEKKSYLETKKTFKSQSNESSIHTSLISWTITLQQGHLDHDVKLC